VCVEREREGGGVGERDSKASQCVSRTTIFQELLTLCVSVSSDGGCGDGSDGSLICKLHHGFPEPPQSFKSCHL
jgi:hypothetical protein